MFITKKHISRRTILKGAGVNLALPFLSAMVPASTALAQTAANPKLRAGFFYIPHGAIMHNTKFGPEADRCIVARHRLLAPAQRAQHLAEIVMRIRIVGLQRDHAGEGRERIGLAARSGQQIGRAHV